MAKKMLGIDDTDYTKSIELGMEIDENYQTQITIPVKLNINYLAGVSINFNCATRFNEWIRMTYVSYGARDFGGDINVTADLEKSYNSCDTHFQTYTYISLPRGHHDGQLISIQHFNQHSVFSEGLIIEPYVSDGWSTVTLYNNDVTSQYARFVYINQQWRVLYTNGTVA